MAGSRFQSLRTFCDRLLAGPSPSDPLYLSNRTWKQKFRLWLLVCGPVVVVLATALYMALRPPTLPEKALEAPSAAEMAARTAVIPDNFRVPQNTDLEIVEVSVERSTGTHISGVLKNNTGQRFAAADLAFDLTDEEGSQVGGAVTRVETIGPHGTVRFRFPISQKNAAHVLVRELRGSR